MLAVRLRLMIVLCTSGLVRAAEPVGPQVTPPLTPPVLKVTTQSAPGGTAERAFGYFGDGTAVAVFRERALNGTQDVHFANWEHDRWSESRVLVPEGWAPSVTPTAPPSADARDGRAVAMWFTAADNDPRAQLSFSSDAGHVWQIPLRLSEGVPQPAVAVVLLRDGAALAMWQEGTRVLLRRVSPLNDLGPVTQIAESRAPLESPSLVVLADRDENAPVRVALSYRADGKSAATVLTLPSLADFAKTDSLCACGQASAQLRRGFELHGTVISLDAKAGATVVRHDAIPGVMPAMTMRFRTDAATFNALAPGQELLGRMEDREAEWWLFDVRLLAAPDRK